MTIEQVSFRDFIRGYIPADILMLLDKKTKANKGLFVKPEYTEIVLKFLEEKEEEKINKKRRAMFDFVGEFEKNIDFSHTTHQEIKAKKYE